MTNILTGSSARSMEHLHGFRWNIDNEQFELTEANLKYKIRFVKIYF